MVPNHKLKRNIFYLNYRQDGDGGKDKANKFTLIYFYCDFSHMLVSGPVPLR